MSSPGDLPTELTLERWTEGGVRESRWTVVSRLGQGESADVLCVRGDGGEELALKWARPGYEAFVGREARALARLGGVGAPRLDAVIRVGEPGRAERRMGLLMERIDGEALDVVSRKDASQASRRRLAQSVLLELGSTLRSLHSMGWAHGDVKPSNVMLAADGRVVLLDFGLSVPVQSSPRGGTPHYWPPELHGGTGCSARTADTFALGVLFAELDGLGSGAEGVVGSSWATALALPAVNERASLAFVLERAVRDWDVEGAARWRRAHLQHLYLAARWSELTWRCEAASALPELRLSGRPRAWLSAAARLLRELGWVEAGIEARAEAGGAVGREPRNENESAVASAALGPLGPHDRSLFLARLVGPRACHFDFWGSDEDGAWIERLWSFAERAPFETLGPSILEGTAAAAGAGAPESREAFLRDGEAPAPEWVVRDWGDDPVTWALGLRDRPPAAELLAHLERRDDLPDALRLEAARVLRRQGAYERAQALLAPGVGEAVELELGLVLARRGNLEAARESIERVASLALDDTSAHARAVLARWSLDRGDLEAARLRLADVGDSAPVCEVRALLALQEGDLARVEDQLTRGRALATQDEQAARLEGVRGMCEHQRGHGEKAHAAFTRAAELAARSLSVLEEATYLTGVAASATDAGHLEEALQAAERAERLFEALGREGDAARAVLSRAAVLSSAGAEWDLEYVVRRGMELAEASRDARCAGYLQLCLVDGRRDDGARRQAAARAAEWLAESIEADRLRARARLLEVTRAPWPEGDALARRLDELEPRAEWWKARAVELLRSFDVADAELVLREARSLGSGGSHSLRGALQVVLAELELELGRTEQARGSLAEAAGHARALLEGLSDERRSVARQLPWVQKAQSLQHSAFEGEQLGDVEALLRSLSQREGLRPLLRQILDALLLWTGVERGLLLLRAPGERLIVRAARNLRRVDLSAEQLELSRSLAERALVERRPIVAVDAAGDLSDSHKSVHALSLRSVLALPLIARGQVLGVAYLDDRVRRGAFGGRELAWAQLIGSIAALTIADERDRLELLRSARKARRSAERARAELSLREVELENAERELDRSRQGRGLRGDYAAIVGNGRAMTDLLRLVDRVAQSDVPVLIQGESGSGKELIARALAHNGPRRGKTFVAENCAAVPETLLESTLFGHVRGAFTGANRARAGLFEVADGGTLLLDEVGEMSLTMQAKLLRVLQSGEIRPLGAERSRQVNVRVICATNRRLDELVERGTFREDLYYRLNVIVLSVPPLRERPEDILPLAEYFLALHSADASRSFSPAVRSRLRAHTWPGNVRQLENEVRRLVVLGEREIVLGDLSPDLLPAVLEAPEGASLRDQVDALERRLVVEALESTRGNRTRAAELLGLSRFGLQKMIERLSIAAPSLRP